MEKTLNNPEQALTGINNMIMYVLCAVLIAYCGLLVVSVVGVGWFISQPLHIFGRNKRSKNK